VLTFSDSRVPKLHTAAVVFSVLALAACGGGGGSGPAPISAQPTSTPSVVAQSVQGSVVLLPVDAFGPVTMTTTAGSMTYQSADATTTTPLANATVIIGPVPITGATPPASLPSGDVLVTTNASGAFAATLSVAPAAATSVEPFVIPTNNITNFAPPALGYYVEVFGVGTDGVSAGMPIPLHRFVSVAGTLALRVSTTSAAEAGALTAVNSDRASNAAAGPLIFDESAEEAARLHGSDLLICHYNAQNIGPSSRYLNVGGIGLTGENVGGGGSTATGAFQSVESATLGEKTLSPPGEHYTNLVDTAHLWAGLAAISLPSVPNGFVVDYELVTPNAQDLIVGSSGYTNAGCTQFTINNS